MFKTIQMSFYAGALLLFMSLITSCTDSEDPTLESVQEYVIHSIDDIQEQGKIGRLGCFEIIFPITINFPDGSAADVDGYPSLRSTIADWKEANPDAEDRPALNYPVELTTEEGEVLSVESQEELRDLKIECRRAFRRDRENRIRNFFRRACFDVVFPVTVEFPNGSVLEAATPATFKVALREWKEANPGRQEERPTLVYPLTVEFEDGTQTSVNSVDEIRALKDTCEAEGE